MTPKQNKNKSLKSSTGQAESDDTTTPNSSEGTEQVSESLGVGGSSSFSKTAPRLSPPIGFRQFWKEPSMTGEGLNDRYVQFGILAVSILVYMTQLGFGLWDCWEPHYAETSRMMLVRNDWLHPFWSYAYFHSKPILMFWYMSLSMSVFGVTEWAIRLPFAAHAVLLIWSVYYIISRLFTQRAGLLAAIIVGTSPLTTFLGRQAMADILVTTYMTMALGFFALAVFGHRELRQRAIEHDFEVPVNLLYLYIGYGCLGLAMLAKGLLGPGIPVLVVGGYLLFSWDWRLLQRARLITGSLLMFAIALPWYVHMLTFPGRNIEDGKTFYDRFILHDNVYRLFRGVHGDEKSHFAYFVRQLGYSMGVWIGFVPLGLFDVTKFRQNAPDAHEKLQRFLFCWWVIIFLFFSFSSTKFHHYVFPLVPISAILAGIWLDRFLSHDEQHSYRYGILIALGLFGIMVRDVIANPHHFVNLFVYKYSRPYPFQDALLLGGSVWKFSVPQAVQVLAKKGGISLAGQMVFRPSPQSIFALFSAGVAAFLLSGYFYNTRRYLVQGMVAIGLLWTCYNAHFFVPRLTPHWSQRPLFELIKQDSKWWKQKLAQKNALQNALQEPIPPEPLIAFRLNWRGEKFYSRNRDLQIMGTYSFTRLYDAVTRHRKPGRAMYFLTEIDRLKQLKRAVGSYDARLFRVPVYVTRWRRMRHKRKLIQANGRRYYWGAATKQNVDRFRRFHNKYLLIKLLPKPTGEYRSQWQLERDRKDRLRGDDWRRRWWYDRRAKKWRLRRWYRLQQQRKKQASRHRKRSTLRRKRSVLKKRIPLLRRRRFFRGTPALQPTRAPLIRRVVPRPIVRPPTMSLPRATAPTSRPASR